MKSVRSLEDVDVEVAIAVPPDAPGRCRRHHRPYDLVVRSDALSHLRVLDLTRVLAGPWASQVLADLGAEVIKVERPGAGDETRAWGPPWLRDAQGVETRESAYFASTNRGKKSITLDFACPEGQAIVRRLAGRADVLLEN